jgi:hypothetical protein
VPVPPEIEEIAETEEAFYNIDEVNLNECQDM